MITADMIKRRRIELGWSQEKLAYYVGITAKTVHNIETGRVVGRPETLEAIEKAMV